MNKLKKIFNSTDQILKKSDLRKITIDIAESLTDSLLNDGLLKEIPLIGTIIGLPQTTISFKDRLLINKLI